MQTCPECGGEARDAHSFCPNCRTPLSKAAKKTGAASSGSGGGSGSDDGLLGGETDVSRRELALYGGAAVGAAAVGGGAGFLLLSGGGGSGPEATARSFVEELDAGNAEEVRDMLHEESGLQGAGFEMTASLMAEADVTIDATEVVSENGTDAEVRVETTATIGGETQSDAAIVNLRKQGGTWRVMNFESP